MTTVPGPSTTGKTRKQNASQSDRQHQRKWIQLIEAWQPSSSSSESFGIVSRDELVEEISHHAQVLCRTIKDRSWLLDAFRMAIDAVLFPDTDEGTPEDAAGLSRIEQLGQQLLQLAIHSVAAPSLNSLKAQNADSDRVQQVAETIEELEQLSRRLSMYERQRSLAQKLALPTLPVSLVLEEPSSTTLLLMASLPRGAELVGSLLQSFPWLVAESAPARLSILTQLLAAGATSDKDYASLAAAKLLIGWKDGRESSIWQAAQGIRQLSLDEIMAVYGNIIKGLIEVGSIAQADALIDLLSKEMQGQDAQQALSQLQSLTTSSAVAPIGHQRSYDTVPSASGKRFDLVSVQAIASKVPSAGQNQKHLAKELFSTQDAASIASRTTQLVDINDSASVRSFALSVVSEAAAGSSSSAALSKEGLAQLAASILYARPAVGRFRFDLNTPQSLLKDADAILAQLKDGHNDNEAGSASSPLSTALRSALSIDRESVVPACQLLALLSSQSKDETDRLTNDAQLHLGWLRSIAALVEGQSDKPSTLDLCWLAAYGGHHQSDISNEAKEEAEEQQTTAFDTLLASFDAAHPPPSSLGGRSDRPGSVDPALLRFRAAWDAFFHRCLELAGTASPSAPFALVPPTNAIHQLLSQVLRTGDVDLFRTLSTTTATSTLSPSSIEDLVLSVSTQLFDKSTVASTRSKDIRLSLDVLSALPSTSPRAKSQTEFIEAACRLSSFKVKSILRPGQPMEPKEIRETSDKMDLVARLLATQGDAHRSPELVLDVANRLCGITASQDKALVEARTLAMLADAATAGEDFDDAAEFCQRLVDKVSTSRGSEAIVELGWKTCFQLSKHPNWEDTPRRISMLAHAMVLCPPTQLGAMLRQWQLLDAQLGSELEGGKVFDSAKKESGWGDLSAASVGAMVGNAANLLPLSFSPLSYFGTGKAPQSGVVGKEGGEVDERTARLFDFDGVSGAKEGGGGGYVDPTERAVRAARAARDFLGWKGDGREQEGQQGGGRGGFSFSRGVGWLIGDDGGKR